MIEKLWDLAWIVAVAVVVFALLFAAKHWAALMMMYRGFEFNQ